MAPFPGEWKAQRGASDIPIVRSLWLAASMIEINRCQVGV